MDRERERENEQTERHRKRQRDRYYVSRCILESPWITSVDVNV